MRKAGTVALLGLATLLAAGCAGNDPLRLPGPLGDVVVGDDRDRDRDDDWERDRDRDRDDDWDRDRGRDPRVYRPRGLNVPRGHYPPPGECRIWYPGRPAGQQPPPARCDRMVGRVPYGAFVLYNGRGWDTRYDWEGHERRTRGSVPRVILRLMDSVRG